MDYSPKIKVLIVIWGQRYIEEFCQISLPSLLAAGNLPSLLEAGEAEILILTPENSPKIFDREPAFQALAALCRVRFIFIDDLITSGNYGVTLTLAYARGVRDSGAEQTNTYFVFMNSDFVLADGSLRSLVKRIAEGHPCIMAPSLRACSENVIPRLIRSARFGANSLAVPARDLVRMALDELHPTVIGKTVTQGFIRCSTHNQLYWQVDSSTLLGRYHLIFMLAIKPERPMPLVSSYCDYGFVPELVPSGRFTVLDDSDEFFMLELQPAEQEKQYLYCGRPSIKEIARELSVWTTREHRRFAQVDLVFHAADLPPDLDSVRRQAAGFMTRLHRMMKKRPVDHVRHFYWVFGVESWLTLRRAKTGNKLDTMLPPECGPLYSRHGRFRIATLGSAYLGVLGWLRQRAGAKPNVPMWHHAWLDSRLLRNWIETAPDGPPQRQLFVFTAHSPLARSLRDRGTFDVIHARDLMDEKALAQWLKAREKDVRYRRILCHIYRSDVRRIRRILEGLSAIRDRDAIVGIYVDHEGGAADPSNFTQELAQYVHDVLPSGWVGLQIRATFAGGITKRRLRLIELRLFRYLWPITWRRLPILPLVPLIWTFVAGFTALNNWWHRHGYKSCPPFCSSALLCLSRPAVPAARDVSRVIDSSISQHVDSSV